MYLGLGEHCAIWQVGERATDRHREDVGVNKKTPEVTKICVIPELFTMPVPLI
jgi:hypothetical protein